MQRSSRGLFSLLAMMLASTAVWAQNNNVGYYEVESYDGDDTILRLVFSMHVEGVENEPSLPGDIPVTWGGGDLNCDGDEQTGSPDCIASTSPQLQIHAFSLLEPEIQTLGTGELIDEVADRIVVVGRRLTGPFVGILRWPGISGLMPALGIVRDLEEVPLPEDPEQDAEECTAAKVGDLNGKLSPEDQQRIADFLNSPAAENMWIDTGYDGPFLNQALRSEQAGFLFPDGTFQRADWDGGMCGGPLPAPPSLPAGTIMIHTHPVTRNESLMHCNSTTPYRNLPSVSDVDYVASFPQITYGLIIDADGFIIFTGAYDIVDSPNQTEHIGGEDGKCGFNRISVN